MWIKKTSLWLDMGHGFLVFNLCVTCVLDDVKISDVRTASSRGYPRFCLVCSLQADAHTLLVPSLGLRPCCLCSREALWLRPFSHDISHSLLLPPHPVFRVYTFSISSTWILAAVGHCPVVSYFVLFV